jgi:hypothetical protein
VSALSWPGLFSLHPGWLLFSHLSAATRI